MVACSALRTAKVAWTPVSRTCSSSPSRMCCTSIRSAPPSANSARSLGERTRTIVDPSHHGQPSSGAVLVAADQARHHAEVDVAAGEHDAGRAVAARRARQPESRAATPDRAGAFDVQLRPVHQQHHRVGDRILVDGDHLVDPPIDERAGELAGVLHGDAVGERERPAHRRAFRRRRERTPLLVRRSPAHGGEAT